MKMKKLLSVVLVAACTLSMAACGSGESKNTGSASDDSDTLVMATNAEFPPYEYHDGDEIVGIDAEFAAAIADKLGKELKIEDMAFDSIIPAVQGGKADFGAAGMTVTDERKTQVDFSDSYYTGRQVIIVAEGSDFATPEDLEGKKIGVQLGTTGDIYASDTPENGGYGEENIERFNKGFEAVQSLLQGKIDAVIIDDQPAKAFVAENDGLKILDTEYIEEEYALCFKKDSKLVAEVNDAIAALKEDGTFDKIVAKYITAE
ncbi:MAG: basic amino acid ABC transporter substrate-binding protein [Hespellia sp.]|nr:basic amino acid ABC transporter substrate-binding protein [Hespellia sp.]